MARISDRRLQYRRILEFPVTVDHRDNGCEFGQIMDVSDSGVKILCSSGTPSKGCISLTLHLPYGGDLRYSQNRQYRQWCDDRFHFAIRPVWSLCHVSNAVSIGGFSIEEFQNNSTCHNSLYSAITSYEEFLRTLRIRPGHVAQL